ncbi:MAG: hypothetical protein RJA81_339, partial [Planctomycetota bacterium]
QELRQVEEENYFFRLTAFADRLMEHYRSHPDFIQPESRRNEVMNLVESGLQDVSISRKGFTWGIPVPFDTEQTIYVWFDALLNYITALGYGSDDESLFDTFWPADVHVIGKDITRFHCALWPAMLMAAGLPLPKSVFAHGFVYNKGQKISKSAGTAIDPMSVYETYGTDPFRYYFLRECSFGSDGNFSEERFIEIYNSDLANNLGNLYSRTISMCIRYFDGALEGSSAIEPVDWRGGISLAGLANDLESLMNRFEYAQALQMIWSQVLDTANRYIQNTEPFKLIKTDRDACKVVLANLADAIRVIGILTKPFLPATGEKYYSAFNFENVQPWNSVNFQSIANMPSQGMDWAVTAALVDNKPEPLFPKIQTGGGSS